MALIWCSISSHGYGHAAQVVPVLNQLARLVPGLTAILRTMVPSEFFTGRLDCPWEISQTKQDIGCIQHGPLTIDVEATWAEHFRFHEDWEKKVQLEAQAIRSRTPDLLLSDISYLAIEAGRLAQVPTVGLCNLSWDLVLSPYLALDQPGHRDDQRTTQRVTQMETLTLIRRAYGNADLMLRPTPSLAMNAFPKTAEIGPIAQPGAADRPGLRKAIGAAADERIVLVGFGGIALAALPFQCLDQLHDYRFIVSGPVPDRCKRIISLSSLPFPFSVLLASADILVTKPGYNTVVEAVAQNTPTVYVRRHNFADESSLVEFLHRHGRGIELSQEDFAAGRWSETLEAVWTAPSPRQPSPPPTGAAEAARILAGLLNATG